MSHIFVVPLVWGLSIGYEIRRMSSIGHNFKAVSAECFERMSLIPRYSHVTDKRLTTSLPNNTPSTRSHLHQISSHYFVEITLTSCFHKLLSESSVETDFSGTTFTCAIIRDNSCIMANIGD